MSETEHLGLLWGVEAIANFIGRTKRQTYHMLEKRELPARQVGRRWVASRKVLREFFEEAPLRGEKR
jgi:hypothetical protein